MPLEPSAVSSAVAAVPSAGCGGPTGARLLSVIVKSGVVEPPAATMAARWTRLMFVGSRENTIDCEVESNDAVTPYWPALNEVMKPPIVEALPPTDSPDACAFARFAVNVTVLPTTLAIVADS